MSKKLISEKSDENVIVQQPANPANFTSQNMKSNSILEFDTISGLGQRGEPNLANPAVVDQDDIFFQFKSTSGVHSSNDHA